MAEDAPNAPTSANAPVATVSAPAGPAAPGNSSAGIPVATISVATNQGPAVAVATVLVAAITPAAAPAPQPRPETAPKETVPAESPEKKHAGGGFALWVVLILAVIGAFLGYLIYKHAKKPPPRPPPAVTVSITNAVKGDIDEFVWGLGTVTPVYTAMMSPRVDGQLVSVNYTEGQLVTSNELLAEIDPGPYQAMLTEAEGQLARDKALLEGAKVDLDRFQQAYLKKAIPKQQVDDETALVHQDEGTVKNDEGQVANAKVQLAYCSIRAPFNGRAGLRLIDPGNVVHAANTNALVVIAQLQPITVVFAVDEKNLPAIQRQLNVGHKMEIEAYNVDQSQKLTTGSFLTMDNLIDIGTGTIRIKALFDNQDSMLFPNQFVNAKLITDTLSNVTLIPTAAIQRNPQGAFVYVVTNKMMTITNKGETVSTNETVVSMRTVTPGVTVLDTMSVQGVDPGEVIVTDNFNKLGDGMNVKLRQPAGDRQKGGPPGGRKESGKKNKAEADAS